MLSSLEGALSTSSSSTYRGDAQIIGTRIYFEITVRMREQARSVFDQQSVCNRKVAAVNMNDSHEFALAGASGSSIALLDLCDRFVLVMPALMARLQ